ncbi:MAG: hypothetical protein PHV85_05115 [Desulfovibrionaceae bacterium]|nr:hypothetical protein [Desulfovibrionaceae bacterium]
MLRIEGGKPCYCEPFCGAAWALIECLPYVDVIRRYARPGTVFYLYPPDWDCETDSARACTTISSASCSSSRPGS